MSAYDVITHIGVLQKTPKIHEATLKRHKCVDESLTDIGSYGYVTILLLNIKTYVLKQAAVDSWQQ